VRISRRRRTEFPSNVALELIAAPVAVVEGRVREDVIGFQIFVQIPVKRVSVTRTEVAIDAADGEVHFGKSPRRGIRLLSVDRDIADFSAMRLDEFLALHEHAAGTAAGIVDTAFV